jgi:hypothetical protein
MFLVTRWWRNIVARTQKTRRQESSPAAGGLETHLCCGYLDRTPVNAGCAAKTRREPAAWRSKSAMAAKPTTPSK